MLAILLPQQGHAVGARCTTRSRDHLGSSLLAMILYAKCGEHQPLNRQSEAYTHEGVDLDVSTGRPCLRRCGGAEPLTELIRRHVLAMTPRCRY